MRVDESFALCSSKMATVFVTRKSKLTVPAARAVSGLLSLYSPPPPLRAPPPHFLPFACILLKCAYFFIVLEKIALVIVNYEYLACNRLPKGNEYGPKIAAKLTTMGFTV